MYLLSGTRELVGQGRESQEGVGSIRPMESIETGSVKIERWGELGSGIGREVLLGMEEEDGTRIESIESRVIWGKTNSSK